MQLADQGRDLRPREHHHLHFVLGIHKGALDFVENGIADQGRERTQLQLQGLIPGLPGLPVEKYGRIAMHRQKVDGYPQVDISAEKSGRLELGRHPPLALGQDVLGAVRGRVDHALEDPGPQRRLGLGADIAGDRGMDQIALLLGLARLIGGCRFVDDRGRELAWTLLEHPQV